MNIGIVTTWFERGGAYVSRQYRDLLRDDFNVYIYARAGEKYAVGDPVWDDDMVTWGKQMPHPVPTAIDKEDFYRWITINKIEAVIFNEQWWWIPLLWCKDWGIKTCAYIDYYTETTIPLFAVYDVLLCNTRRHFDAFSWHPGAHYISWGTDIELFRPASLLPATKGIVTFFHSAGVSPKRKGTDFVIEAFAQAQGNKKLIIHSQVDLTGTFPDLKSLMDRLVLDNELTVIEDTVSAPGCYHLGDVYVYPSRLDGIGLTIAEALSCGLPVIVPDNPPMNEFVDETCGRKVAIQKLYCRADGYYWPQCDVSIPSLIEQMQWYLDRMDKIGSFKQQARQYATANLNWKKNKDRLIAILKDISYHASYDTNAIIAYEHSRECQDINLVLRARWPALNKMLDCLIALKQILTR